MFFKMRAAVICIPLSILTSGCGVLGEKEDIDKIIRMNSLSTGCLNNFGPQFNDFLEGKVRTQEWNDTWTCVSNALKSFKRYVRGSGEEGAYTSEDMLNFMNKFLITNRTVSRGFMEINMQLKATLFGGRSSQLGHAEIDRLIDMVAILKEETTTLIPHFMARVDEPTPKNLIALADAMIRSGKRLSGFFKTQGNLPFSREQIEILLTELTSTFSWKIHTDMVPAAMALKELLLPGKLDVISGDEWHEFFQIASEISGMAIAMLSSDKRYFEEPNAGGRFYFELTTRLKTLIDRSIAINEGRLPYSKLYQILDRLPDRLITFKRSVVKEALPTINAKLLWSLSKEGIDAKGIRTLYSLFEKWTRGQTHLEAIFEQGKFDRNGVTDKDFTEEANEYLRQYPVSPDTMEDRRSILRLTDLINYYRPTFVGDSGEMFLSTLTSHSLNDASLLHLFNLISGHALASYGKAPGGYASIEDLAELLRDYSEIAFEFKLLDPTIKNLHIKRFREADLFTYASNGNNLLDSNEITYYLLTVKSSYMLAGRIRAEIENVCGAGEIDNLGWKWMPISCFREEYRKRLDAFWKNFPNLSKYYENLGNKDRDALIENMEKGFRRNGLSNDPIGGGDIYSLAGYLHYIEAVFVRYDLNNDQILDKDEAIAMFPNFKGILSSIAPGNASEKMLESAFTYVLKYRRMPTGDIWRMADFLLWHWRRPLWQISADRGAVYEIVPILTQSN